MNYSKAIKLLNLNYNANESEIKNSYKKLAKIYHPDKNQGDKDKEEKFKEIQVAYDFLVKNPNPQLQFHQENIFQQGFNIDQLFSQFNINNNLFNNNLFNNYNYFFLHALHSLVYIFISTIKYFFYLYDKILFSCNITITFKKKCILK